MVVLYAVSQVSRHIQPPAVHIVGRGYPLAADFQYIVLQLLRALVVQLGQGVVPPPAVVTSVVGPARVPALEKFKEIPVGAVRGDISSLFIPLLALVDPFPVHPLVKRTTMVKNAVEDDFHSPPVKLFHKLDKKLVTGLQVFPVRHPLLIFRRIYIFLHAHRERLSAVLHDDTKMRVNVVVVLDIVLVVGR